MILCAALFALSACNHIVPCEAYLTVRLRANLGSFFMRDDWAKLVLLGPKGEQVQLK